jgi:hypothetical protein
MKTQSVVKVGLCQKREDGMFLESLFPGKGFVCAWNVSGDPREQLKKETVNVLLMNHRYGDALASIITSIRDNADQLHIVLTSPSELRAETVVHLTELGACLIHLPKNKNSKAEQRVFLRKLKKIAAGQTLVDSAVVSKTTAQALSWPNIRHLIDSPESPLFEMRQQRMVA